jgi:hypothetical protein
MLERGIHAASTFESTENYRVPKLSLPITVKRAKARAPVHLPRVIQILPHIKFLLLNFRRRLIQ